MSSPVVEYKRGVTHAVRATLAYTDEDVAKELVKIPGNCLYRARVLTTTGFNDGTAATISVGHTSAAYQDSVAAADVAAAGEDNGILALVGASDTVIYGLYEGTDGDASAGAAIIVIEFWPYFHI